MTTTMPEQVAVLRKKYSAEQIKMFWILGQMTEYQRIIGGDESRDEHLQKTINILNTVPGLDVEPKSMSEVESAFARCCLGQGSYKEVMPSWFDPTLAGNIFNAMSRDSNDFRDRDMVSLIARTVGEKKRVFAVVGASHVVMQEKAIREMLKERPTK